MCRQCYVPVDSKISADPGPQRSPRQPPCRRPPRGRRLATPLPQGRRPTLPPGKGMHAMYFFHKPPGGPPAGARRRTRQVALAAAVITALGTVLAVAVAAPAFAQAGTPPYWAQSPFSVPSGTGATVPFTEYEAENASTNGTIIGPSFAQGTLPSEASGREAVQLTAQGQYVKFTLTSPANAFDLHYALAQGASGTLSVYVNGTKLSQELNLTSAYSYITTSDITGSQAHKFYDDARMMFGQTLAAGTTVRLQV